MGGKEHWTTKGEVRLFLWQKPAASAARGTILFVHGSSMASQPTFDLQVPGRPDSSVMDWFAARGFDTWCLDNEGYGRSDKSRPINFDIRTGADDLEAASEYVLGNTGAKKLLVYGISSGALKAALFATRHPERVARLALDAFVWTGEGSATLAERRKRLAEFRAARRRPIDREFVRGIFARDHPGTADEATVNAFADAILALDDSVPTGTYVDMCSMLPIVEPEDIAVPTIVMRGEFDGIAGFDDLLEFFRRLPNPDKQFCVMPGISHASFQQNPRVSHPARVFQSTGTGLPRMKGLFLIAGLLFSLNAFPQSYPSRPIRLVIPFAAGGLADVPGRIIAQKLSQALGQPVVVENKPGAGSTIGADFVAKSKPDGYTLLLTSTTHVISANLYRKLGYDALRDFAPVMKIAEGPYVLVVHPGLAVKNVAELVAAARAAPGRIDYASSGNGSSQHLVTALFCAMAGAPLNHIPYKGSDRATQDIIGGQVKVGFMGTPNALPHVRSGRLRALAVSTARRSPELPDVPTMQEAGVVGYEATIWMGLFAPAGATQDVVSKLTSEITRVLQSPDSRASISATGVEVSLAGAEEFGAFVRAEHGKWGKVVRDTGATVN